MACERISDAGAFAYGWIPVDAVIRVWFNTSGHGLKGCVVATTQSNEEQCTSTRKRGGELAAWHTGEQWRPSRWRPGAHVDECRRDAVGMGVRRRAGEMYASGWLKKKGGHEVPTQR